MRLLDFDSPWPCAAVLLGLLAFAATPLMKAADSPPIPAGRRISTLDGLRGFLALFVFFHHTAIFRERALYGTIDPPADRFFALLGPLGVSVFFMITGFLFWSQLIAAQGRPNWVRLYIGRIFRIGPLYIFAISVLAVITLVAARFHLLVTPFQFVVQVLDWMIPLGAHMGSSINNYPETRMLVGVTWTLHYEWIFYASLLVTALALRWKWGDLALPIAGLAVAFPTMLAPVPAHMGLYAPFLALFCVGMLTAGLSARLKDLDFDHPALSGLASGAFVAVLLLFRTTYAPLPICLLAVFFFLVANGVTLFGLLATRPARRLGNISYGIYLLQLLLLGPVFDVPLFARFTLISPTAHWLVVAVTALALVIVATLTHAGVERPGIDLGRFVAGRLRPPATRARPGLSVSGEGRSGPS